MAYRHGPWRGDGSRGGAVTSMTQTAQADGVYIGTQETLRQAGHRMRQLGVVGLLMCGEDGELKGVISRDMVIGSIAAGGDPTTVTVGEVASYDHPRSGTGLRPAELADAVRAAADAVSRLGAITAACRPSAAVRPDGMRVTPAGV
jgi:CBS domain-containing protein